VATATQYDVQTAQRAGIPLDVLLAIRAVESGSRATAVRFEPHVFWRARKGFPRSMTGGQIRDSLTAAELAAVPYTPCSLAWREANGLAPCTRRGAVYDQAASLVGAETNRAAFERAARLDTNAAIDATSWGLYQVLGGHLRALYPQDPVGAFDANPERVSEELLVRWMSQNDTARRAAVAGDLRTLALRYNGNTRWGEAMAAALAHIRASGVTVVGGGGSAETTLAPAPAQRPSGRSWSTVALVAAVAVGGLLAARYLAARRSR